MLCDLTLMPSGARLDLSTIILVESPDEFGRVTIATMGPFKFELNEKDSAFVLARIAKDEERRKARRESFRAEALEEED